MGCDFEYTLWKRSFGSAAARIVVGRAKGRRKVGQYIVEVADRSNWSKGINDWSC